MVQIEYFVKCSFAAKFTAENKVEADENWICCSKIAQRALSLLLHFPAVQRDGPLGGATLVI